MDSVDIALLKVYSNHSPIGITDLIENLDLDLSASSVGTHIKYLRRNGFITVYRKKTTACTTNWYEITEKGKQALEK